MNILFCQFGALGEKAMTESFRRMEHSVTEFFYRAENYDYDKNFMNTFVEKIQDERYNIVFSINFMPLVSKVCQVYRCVYLCWVYDSPEIHLYSKAVANPVNRIFIFDRMLYERTHRFSPQNVYYMPLATTPMTEQEMADITEREQNEYTSDVCFVGALCDEGWKKKYLAELSNLPDYWQGYINGIVNAQLNVFGYNFISDSLSNSDVETLKSFICYEWLDDYRQADREVIADIYIGAACSFRDRIRTLKRLSQNFMVTLYTTSETDDLRGDVIDNRGYAHPIRMTPKIFHCSKINLNITSKTIQTGIPLRVFDVLGSKGFLITNYQRELLDYFEPGVDLVIYEGMEDLERKVGYYLSHETERLQIAENGYRKVCECYTFDIMLEKMLSTI